MERVEEFEQASKEQFNITLPPGISCEVSEALISSLRSAFVIGAMWADSHPFIEQALRVDGMADLNISEND